MFCTSCSANITPNLKEVRRGLAVEISRGGGNLLPSELPQNNDKGYMSRMLPQLDEMIGGGLITLEKVRVILYRAHK